MKLEVPDSDTSIDEPSESEVMHAIEDLRWEEMADTCIDLERDDYEFFQVIARADGRYDLRIRLGKEAGPMQTLQPVSLTKSKSCARAYMVNDLQWRSELVWEETPVHEFGNPLRRFLRRILP